MRKLSGPEVRQSFLDYFASRGHAIVPSSSLVPREDPTLLFTNAGMVQFKDCFLGLDQRGYNRAASCQKCVRAGGKHNDLENVGRTARHHTFFEMLGNFSFGDYFKEEAIAYAWEWMTVDLGLPPERLWATIYKEDDEACELWQKLAGLPADRIVRLGEKDNFWAMGDTGPCGPCSEIVIDQGPEVGCGRPTCDIECDCDRYLELWNLVFMQFNRDASGTLTPLPKPSIDTGAGLERITAVVQGVHSNFDTDLLRPLVTAVEELSGRAYGARERDDVSMRVIADHARAATFLVSDGVLPSNEGRGYVLRRIVRRALRHGKLLGLEGPFLAQMTGRVVDHMKEQYPELQASRDRVARETLAEEERFGHTLRMAIPRLEEEIAQAKQSDAQIPADKLFKLYDTYGLPLDLMEELAQEQRLTLDRANFEAIMQRHREIAKASAVAMFKGTEVSPVLQELATSRSTPFVGYDQTEVEAEVTAIVKAGQSAEAVQEGEEAAIILDRTPFYAEAGGQVADVGTLQGSRGVADVLDVQRPLPGLTVHRVLIARGSIRKGDRLRAAIDAERRALVLKNHTATHLVHEALHRVLGDHVRQEGSLVAPDRLRFDFRHYGPTTAAELARIERMVNEQLWRNLPVMIEDGVPYEEALARGAKAFFADKYADRVRTVTVPGFGLELCGGTHVQAIGEIGLFKIASEGGVAAGIRRIEANTGPGAYDYLLREEAALQESADALKARPLELPEKVDRLTQRGGELEREIQRLRSRVAATVVEGLLKKVEAVEGLRVVRGRVEHFDQKGLRELVDRVRTKLGSGVVVLGTLADNRVAWVAGITPDIVPRVHAGKLVREMARMTGGEGGGRADLAEAGGKDPSRLDHALGQVPELVRQLLGEDGGKGS
ncbi:MAG: alanine--tRNA ligase [candidate division NC10 bacterium]|nr:alanine--tRNA ligase [candidate division NC10 bacterium]